MSAVNMEKGNSDLVFVNENVLANQAAKEMPSIASVHVSKSSRVHIGPKIVAVNQTIENKEMIKGHVLGLELVSTKSTRRLRCSVAVFLCWALLVASGLTVYFVYFALLKHQIRLDIGLNASWYLRRSDWQAMKAYGEDFLNLPVQYVIVGHTAGKPCDGRYDCVKRVLDTQNENLKSTFDDIAPNFLVGGKEFVFEGRGANVVGAVARFWNLRCISVMFIGDFRTSNVTQKQFEHLQKVLDTLVEKYVLRPDYIVYGNCQVSPDTISPGPNVMNNLRNLTHWNSTNADRCIK